MHRNLFSPNVCSAETCIRYYFPVTGERFMREAGFIPAGID